MDSYLTRIPCRNYVLKQLYCIMNLLRIFRRQQIKYFVLILFKALWIQKKLIRHIHYLLYFSKLAKPCSSSFLFIITYCIVEK